MIPLIIALLYFSTSAETFKISTFALRLYVFSIHYILLIHPFVLIFFSSITFYCTLFSTTLYIVFCIGKISYTFYQELHWFMARTFNSKYQKKKTKKKTNEIQMNTFTHNNHNIYIYEHKRRNKIRRTKRVIK